MMLKSGLLSVRLAIMFKPLWLLYLELAYQNGLSPVGAVWVLNKFAIVAKIFVGKLAFLV